MDVREKLVHLIESARYWGSNTSEEIADHLLANGVTLLFDSEKSACEFLGVKKCSVSSCYHKGYKCNGYRIAKMDLEENK